MTTKPKRRPVRAWGVFVRGKLREGYGWYYCTKNRADAEFVAKKIENIRSVEIRELPRKRKVRK